MRTRPWIRGLISGLAVLAALALAALAWVFGASEWALRRTQEAPLLPLNRPATPDLVAGERMARIAGCWSGCHGPRGEGGTESIEGLHRNTAPTLSAVLPLYSDEELVRLIRYGVKRDGRSAVGMSSYALWPLGDEDLANIMAHLRRQPPLPPVPREHVLELRGRVALATGAWDVSAGMVDRSVPRYGELPRRDAFERGRYLASIVCSECHGLDWRGNALEGGPSLVVINHYPPEAFRRLMHTGVAWDGRAVSAMAGWLPGVAFTDEEIADLDTFLRRYHGLEPAAGASAPATP